MLGLFLFLSPRFAFFSWLFPATLFSSCRRRSAGPLRPSGRGLSFLSDQGLPGQSGRPAEFPCPTCRGLSCEQHPDFKHVRRLKTVLVGLLGICPGLRPPPIFSPFRRAQFPTFILFLAAWGASLRRGAPQSDVDVLRFRGFSFFRCVSWAFRSPRFPPGPRFGTRSGSGCVGCVASASCSSVRCMRVSGRVHPDPVFGPFAHRFAVLGGFLSTSALRCDRVCNLSGWSCAVHSR